MTQEARRSGGFATGASWWFTPFMGAEDGRSDPPADARDAHPEPRENELDRAEMTNPRSEYGAHWPERRRAGLDRGRAKDDRQASRDDRIALTEGDVEPDTDRT